MQVLRKGFKQALNPQVAKFVASVNDDTALIATDLDGSVAHATMLEEVGLLTADQADNIRCGLAELKQVFEAGKFTLKENYEDVHMNVEKQLEEKIGADALRLHTARSRNDQVALDTRLLLRVEIAQIQAGIKQFQLALIKVAEQHIDTVMPGYTHLQRGQPVSFAHALLAFFEMLERDKQRFFDCLKRTSVSPLGAGALAGTSLPIDPKITAKYLGLEKVFSNSLDAVTDRDFVAEFLFCASLTAVHLSQLAESLIIWCSKEFSFVQFSDSVTTTSSLMPQKKNPDPIELVRGKTGSILGNLINILITLKGLPLGYNRDLQEVKQPAIESADTLKASLAVMALVIAEMSVNKPVMLEAASDPEVMATDLAEYLVRKGLPFRQAHEAVAGLVAYAREKDKSLMDLSPDEYKLHSGMLSADAQELLDPHVSIKRKVSHGSTGMDSVNEQLKEAAQLLKQ